MSIEKLKEWFNTSLDLTNDGEYAKAIKVQDKIINKCQGHAKLKPTVVTIFLYSLCNKANILSYREEYENANTLFQQIIDYFKEHEEKYLDNKDITDIYLSALYNHASNEIKIKQALKQDNIGNSK